MLALLVPVLTLALVLCLVPVAFSVFSAQTPVTPGSFSAGSVELTDDDTGAAMFTAGSLRPGSTGSRCIAVSYSGSLAAQVRLFVAPGDLTGTGLDRYLTLTVTEGTGGGSGSCAGFAAAGPADFTGTLRDLAATATTWDSGIGGFAPAGAGETRVYRIVYTLTAGAAAEGLAAQVRFTWEARNT
ncbi:hypothetical protein KIH74_21390 [Kineosporia sp. J2-2]|uniref:Camelysin metallo-endopeptidase n=1 Tax=Kineosporia corallincola TaxID=2835133 RepID=A0ABS5TMT1_9ACTN|nr:hypothetical protein [Kineosporia corallincola]MBT0771506.1 hypothetical protein [Kineosporia corallincola]